MSLDSEERILVEGPEPRLLFVDDMIGFTKTDESFLEAKEELKILKKKQNAILTFHKVALRLERCFCMGFSIQPTAKAEAIHRFALTLRESPLPDPRKEYERMVAEMAKRDLDGIELLSKDGLVNEPGMEAATRVLLTLMRTAASGVTDDDLPGWAASFQRIAGTHIVQDIVANIHHLSEGPRQEAMQAAFMAAMAASDLVSWRTSLEEQGQMLAQELVKETNPATRAQIESRLKGLSKLLTKVNDSIPDEVQEKELAKRVDRMEEKKAEQLQLIAAALVADPIGFLKKMSSEREKNYYERSVSQCVEAFAALMLEHVPIARLVLQALQAHLRPVAEVPWRADLATVAIKELATERSVARFLELMVNPDKPENKDHARAALMYFGVYGVPLLVARLEKPAEGEADVPLQAAAAGLLKELAPVAEQYLSGRLAESAVALPVARVALDVIGLLKKAERFEMVSKFSNHTDHGVRESALRALALLDPAKGQALIKRSIGDRDFNISRTAILLLGELKTTDWSVVQQFLETVKRREKDVPEPDEKLQLVTAQALGMLGNISLRTGGNLEDHLLDLVQAQQEKKLLGLGGGKLRDKSPTVRGALCEALGHIGGDKTLQMMRKLALNDTQEIVKAKARDAVKMLNARTQKPGTPATPTR
jgi:HEAT repeat protein